MEETLRAFAAETDAEVDDKAIDELSAGVERLSAVLRQAAIGALKLSVRLEVLAPSWLAKARDGLDRGDEARERAAQFARLAATRANEIIGWLDALDARRKA